jgi:response regulator RpfG family c-di-GMP phosphodiesterase/two-component sensor histidine kinase
MHQLKANFLSTVSHELRTPVTAIRAFVDTMLGAGYGEINHQQAKHFLTIINEEAQRLSRLIESLLDLNRFDSGVMRSSRQSVELADVVQEVVQLLEPVAQVGQVALKLEPPNADTRVDASRDQMRQLVLHLGNNAVKFTPPGGSVTFVLSGDGPDVGLEVVDTGIGIPQESLERIFERFYQVDSSLVRRYGGTGLGLAICKSIVEYHGGRIRAESTEGQGSRFLVRMPRRSRPRVVVQPGPEPEAAPADILRLAIEMVAEVMGARVVSLLCPEPDGTLVIRAAMGIDEDVVRRVRVEPGSGVAGWVAANRRPVCVSGSEEHPEVAGSGRALYESRTFVSVPIEHSDTLLGVLNATDPVQQRHFDAEDCHLFLQLAQRIAAAWHQALTAQEQQAGVADTANTLRQLLRHLERGRRNAPDRVRLARALARELGLPEDQVGAVSFAASVHDVGMRTVGEGLVEGAGTLTAADRQQLERHPEAGADLLAPLETAGGVRDLVLSHHEWWNGSGYPRGLREEDIPVGSRILAVVDAYESMTVGRPHRPAVPRSEALKEIERLSGTQFDPRVVGSLTRALEQLDSQNGPEAAASANPTLAAPGR